MNLKSYRNIETPELLSDDSYGIEGRYLVSIYAKEGSSFLTENESLTYAGKIVTKLWKDISEHFDNTETGEYIISPNSFVGYINIDLSGRTIGKKHLYFNVVSPFEIAFGLMVSNKNPFLVEGSLYHIVSWFKASSMVEILKDTNSNFRWESGYFDFQEYDNRPLKELVPILIKSQQI
jgi:putative transposase